jgi:hypothetical protein|tara:strand:- start:5729 stop:5905 length:177 start_codon:yes stop_codon:yes gene_type:complete
MQKDVVKEILQVVKMSIKLRTAVEGRLAWGQDFRTLLNLPKTESNKELIEQHWANGTE